MKVITFGEILLRLAAPGFTKLFQKDSLDSTFCGGEANVAVSLSIFGLDSAFVTKLPDNDVGRAAVNSMRYFGVDTRNVIYGNGRMGLYYLEKGASQRPSKVIYDRESSAIALAKRSDFDWDKIFDGADWFHWTGINPALSDELADICEDACKMAKEKGLTVSCDLNYRGKLWSPAKAQKIMKPLMKYVDVCICNEEDSEKVLGIKSPNTDVETGDLNKAGYIYAAEMIYSQFGCKYIATTLRKSYSASRNGWSAVLYDAEAFSGIQSVTEENGKSVTNPEYSDYVVPARQALARKITKEQPGTLIIFIVLLLIALVSMATFRSPAVALMPDVTMKPLRSKANAVINLMGSAGGILALILGMVFATSAVRNSMMSYTGYFAVVSGIMLAALAVFMLTVKEPQFVREMQEESKQYEIDPSGEQAQERGGSRTLSEGEKRSLIFLFASIVFWFAGYNAVTSKYSVYAGQVLHKDYNLTLIIAQLAAIFSYLPVGMIASRAGRKKTILAGVVMLAVSFAAAAFMRADSPSAVMNAVFALAGIAWATINVNSFPMVVEMCSESDVGKYTGLYYTASMAAQVATPIFSGFLMDRLGMTILFPYAVCFVLLALATMMFVRHGDSKPVAKKGLAALEDMDAE